MINRTTSTPGLQLPDTPLEIETTQHEVDLDLFPRQRPDVVIAQLSDLHRGCGGTDRLIEEAIRRCNATEPDFIALTGDFVDEHKRDILPAVKMVAGLRARRGIFACLGNHDQRGDPILLASALEAAGIRVLHNRAEEALPGLWFAGVDDITEGRPDVGAALAEVPGDAALVFLAHNPSTVDRMPRDREMLMLSGHTHGGQIVLPVPSPSVICRFHLRTPYVHGWFRRGAARLYVNRGIGVTGSGPFARRYHCPPELSEFRLTGAQGSSGQG